MLVCRLAPEGMRRAERRLRRLAHVPLMSYNTNTTVHYVCSVSEAGSHYCNGSDRKCNLAAIEKVDLCSRLQMMDITVR